MRRLGVGFALHADLDYLELARSILEDDADFFEVNPETLWRMRGGRLERNDYRPLFLEMKRRSRKPFVAHGLAFSIGSPLARDRARTSAWLERLRDDHATFGFEYLTEHLGWVTAEGLHAVLPLPLPPTQSAVAAVAARMRLLARVVPAVGFENNVTYFALGDVAREPDFFNAICRAAPCGMLLDLHNVHTQCRNAGVDAREYVDRIDASNVIEIHLSGGSESEAGWLKSGRVYRLDSHDGPVPEEAWSLLERVLPRCRSLRGIVVERLNGTFAAGDVPALSAEVKRAKELLRKRVVRRSKSPAPPRLEKGEPLASEQKSMIRALTSDEPSKRLKHADVDGVSLTGLLVRKLRFERICRGDETAEAWFERDPRGFTEAFKRYNREVPPRDYFPRQEAETFRRWCEERGVHRQEHEPTAKAPRRQE